MNQITHLICPISHQIFLNPVVASDGHIYELTEISLWQSTHETSPITREIINNIFYTSRRTKDEVDNYLQLYPEELNNQYKMSNNNLEIENHIKNGNYKKLLLYDNFDHKFINEEVIKKCPSYILKYIIDKCINLEASDNNGRSPIHYICRNSTPEIIKYIIDKNVNLEVEDDKKMRPIHIICRYSTPEIIKYIIDKNVDLECENIDKWRPIHIICRYSAPEMIKYIMDKNVNLECENINKWRPIHFICRYSTPEMIKYIIDKNVNLECETSDKWRPIHFICRYSTPEIIKYIIDKNVNLECETIGGYTPNIQLRSY